MVSNPPEGSPHIAPYLLYEDAGAAGDFLVSAFGFREHFRMAGPDGKVMHAEYGLGDGVVMMGCPGPDYTNPGNTDGNLNVMVHVYVDDVDAHCERAKAAGAKITAEPEDQFYGDRRYIAEDPAGHKWSFATHVRDVPPEEMQP